MPYHASAQVVRVEGSRLYVRDPTPAPSPPMCVTTCWLAATWPLLPLPALPPGMAIDVQTKELEVGKTGRALGHRKMLDASSAVMDMVWPQVRGPTLFGAS